MIRHTTLSTLISELQQIQQKYGDLPVGGEDTEYVVLTVCDDHGCDAEHYGRPADHVFVETL